MVLCQMFLTATSQVIDLNLPAGRYRVKLTGASMGYITNNQSIFALQLHSQFTMMKYGNIRYLQIQCPIDHWAQITGDLLWEIDYYGPFQMDIIDFSTGVAPVVPDRFSQATLFFDVEAMKPTNLQHVV